MSKVDKDYIKQKIALALKILEKLEKTEFTKEQLATDMEVYPKVYFLYQNVIERCLGIASYACQMLDLPIPTSARDTFMQLADKNIIDKDTARRLSGAYGFRNMIIHDYDEINVDRIYMEHKNNLMNIRDFLKQLLIFANA